MPYKQLQHIQSDWTGRIKLYWSSWQSKSSPVRRSKRQHKRKRSTDTDCSSIDGVVTNHERPTRLRIIRYTETAWNLKAIGSVKWKLRARKKHPRPDWVYQASWSQTLELGKSKEHGYSKWKLWWGKTNQAVDWIDKKRKRVTLSAAHTNEQVLNALRKALNANEVVNVTVTVFKWWTLDKSNLRS